MMIRLRSLAMVGLACLAIAGVAAPLEGCTQLQAIFGAPSAQAATTVGAAENAYTVTANLATVYLKSGKATKANAQAIAAADKMVYADLVAARSAVAANNSPAIATALAQFNQDLPQFQAAIPKTGS